MEIQCLRIGLLCDLPVTNGPIPQQAPKKLGQPNATLIIFYNVGQGFVCCTDTILRLFIVNAPSADWRSSCWLSPFHDAGNNHAVPKKIAGRRPSGWPYSHLYIMQSGQRAVLVPQGDLGFGGSSERWRCEQPRVCISALLKVLILEALISEELSGWLRRFIRTVWRMYFHSRFSGPEYRSEEANHSRPSWHLQFEMRAMQFFLYLCP